MKILIVDDSAFMRQMLKSALKEGSHEILEAGNSDEAIKLFRDSKPDFVFLDIILPGKNGVEILKEMKAIDSSKKIVMCTSIGGQQKIMDESIEAGASDIIVKPFKAEDITGVLGKS